MTLLQLVRQALCLTVSIEVAKTDDNGRLIIPHRFREVWIDVGANDGLEWPKPWPSDVFVLAFEPLLDKYSRQLARFSTPLAYHKNAVPLGHFDSQGIILPFAISSEEGNATFHVQALDGCSSLLKFGERKLAGYGRHVTTTCKDAVETRTVPTISLKTVLERWLPPHLRATRLKVDAQGMDMAIVNTAGPRLADFDIVKMESYPSDCEPMYEGMPLCTEIVRNMLSKGFVVTDGLKAVQGACLKTANARQKGTCTTQDITFRRPASAMNATAILTLSDVGLLCERSALEKKPISPARARVLDAASEARGTPSAVKRVALVLFGTAPHRKRSGINRESLRLLKEVCAPQHQKLIMAPLQSAGFAVDSFVHTWDAPTLPVSSVIKSAFGHDVTLKIDAEPSSATLCAMVKERFPVFPLSSCGQIGALLSMERALRLREVAERERGTIYDWVMLRRLDLIQYTAIDLAGLTPGRLYISNDCQLSKVSGAPGPQKRDTGLEIDGLRCAQLTELGWLQTDWSIPDFVFLSSPAHIDRLFQGTLNDTRLPQQQDFPEAVQRHFLLYNFSMHFFLRWRIGQLGMQNLISRFQYHHIDYAFVRGWAMSIGQCNASSPLAVSWWWQASSAANASETAQLALSKYRAALARAEGPHPGKGRASDDITESVCSAPDRILCSWDTGWKESRAIFGHVF